jgi:prepilin-type N-terminal cleavage/methylation domain-containing protein/prepilin-type processing-associated H-X9-DG protein
MSSVRQFRSPHLRIGFTLVELLVVVAIVGILSALLLPAVQTARESGRLAHCQNNFRQLNVSLLAYHDAYRSFPHGGWGHAWVGIPERGRGKRQPGGWIFGLLPFIENAPLFNLGNGLSGQAAIDAYSQRLQTPIPLLVCPSRRRCSTWAVSDKYPWVRSPRPFGDVTLVARADYAINAGTSHVFSFSGPVDLNQGDDSAFWQNSPNPKDFSGISHLRIGVATRSVADGTSKTYLIGEKYLEVDDYSTGESPGDNESLYAGYCTDLHRFAGVVENLKLSRSPFSEPLNDHVVASSFASRSVRFGSAHQSGVNMAYCDGSVHFIGYDIDPDIHFRAGHREDSGSPIDTLD